MVVSVFGVKPTQSQLSPERTDSPVAIVSVVVVQSAIGVDIAGIVGVGSYKAHPKRFYLPLSLFFHAKAMYFTSQANLLQCSQLPAEINCISKDSSIKNKSSLT